jgi:glycosyltransferase involved in cell wall biosynthesis
MPKISVVIPSYNRAHLIAETIQSVLAQTFQDFEIIVVDDGSSDNTQEVISHFPVRYFYQENKGASAARNTGIRLSLGEYIAFLDSDDLLLRHALQRGVEALNMYPEAGFSYGQAYLMNEREQIFGLIKSSFVRHSSLVDGKEIIREMLTTYTVPINTTMVRRRCLNTIGGFDESLKTAEDRAFHVSMAKRYPVVYIAEPLIKYRVHSGSTSAAPRLKEMENYNRIVLESIFNDEELGPMFQRQRRNAYFELYYRLADQAYGSNMMKTARTYIFRSIRIHPRASLRGPGALCMFLFAKTWLPLPLLSLYRRGKQYLRIATNRRLRLVEKG